MGFPHIQHMTGIEFNISGNRLNEDMETWHPGSCWAEVSGTALWTTWKAPCVTQTMPGISHMKWDQYMIPYDTVCDRHHLFAIIPHIFPRSRSFFWLSCGWDDTTWVPRPKATGWWHHIRHWRPCRSRWICHPKNHCLLVSSCFIWKHAPKIIIAHVLECLRMLRQDGCVSRFLVFFIEKIDT